MAIVRWRYRPDYRDLFETMQRGFDRFFEPAGASGRWPTVAECPVDIREDDDNIRFPGRFRSTDVSRTNEAGRSEIVTESSRAPETEREAFLRSHSSADIPGAGASGIHDRRLLLPFLHA